MTPQVDPQASNRYQRFDAKQVERAALIREAQALGFTLREISALSAEFAAGMTVARQAELLRTRLAAVEAQAARLRHLKHYFVAKLAWLNTGGVGEPPLFSVAPEGLPDRRCGPAAGPRKR